MNKGKPLVEINWDVAGALLADADFGIQAQFFKAFVRECKSWPTHHQIEIQLLSIAERLTTEEQEILNMICYNEEEGKAK